MAPAKPKPAKANKAEKPAKAERPEKGDDQPEQAQGEKSGFAGRSTTGSVTNVRKRGGRSAKKATVAA